MVTVRKLTGWPGFEGNTKVLQRAEEGFIQLIMQAHIKLGERMDEWDIKMSDFVGSEIKTSAMDSKEWEELYETIKF